jgi:hypothetical protein
MPKGVVAFIGPILALSDHSLWVTGGFGKGNSVYWGALVLNWNGKTWTRVPTGDSHDLGAGNLASDGHGGVWMVLGNLKGQLFGHYSGHTWTREAAPTQPSLITQIGDIALIPSTRSLWATGSLLNTSIPTNDAHRGVIFKYGP